MLVHTRSQRGQVAPSFRTANLFKAIHITGFKFLDIYKSKRLVLIKNYIGSNTNNLYEISSPNLGPLKDWKCSIIHPLINDNIRVIEGIIYFSQAVEKDEFHTHKSYFPFCVFSVQSAHFGVVPCKQNMYNYFFIIYLLTHTMWIHVHEQSKIAQKDFLQISYMYKGYSKKNYHNVNKVK